MIDKQQFTELKAKYNVPENEINHSDSSFLYFILAKADIDVNLLNDVDLNWLADNNFLATYEKLEQKKEEKENRIKKLAQENFSPIYNKYIYLFTLTPGELFGFKHKFKEAYLNTEYAIKALTGSCASILFKLDSLGHLNLQEIDYLKKKALLD